MSVKEKHINSFFGGIFCGTGLFLFSENISTFAMCDLGYYDYGARLKRTQKELLNLK